MWRYLALGDSYTIGEQVLPSDSFPFQLTSQLQQLGLAIAEPEIIAKTGWTTGELLEGIRAAAPEGPFDLVTLLIGVNNQYRGLSVATYEREFEELLLRSIELAGGRSERVAVVSIPDWGVTPYAAERNRARIASEIDQYNAMAANICRGAEVVFVEITEGTREAATDPGLLTGDGLHPSGKEYARWAAILASYYRGLLL